MTTPPARHPSFRVTLACLLGACLAAFALRVLPALDLVYPDASQGTAILQGSDPWFHLRTAQNLLAHFPWRSSHDPFMLHPGGGQAIPTAPLWDYIVAGIAWVLGLGAPDERLSAHVAAWLPAVIGGLFPLAVYPLGARLFGRRAGLLAAWWLALLPGLFLWHSHLGAGDHHAIESLLAFLTLLFLLRGLHSPTGAARFGLAAGLSLGGYLLTRPAGIFIPASLALATALAPRLAAAVLTAVGIAALVFAPAGGIMWSKYTWLSLGAAALAASTVRLAALRGWTPRGRFAALLGAGAIAVGLLLAFIPSLPQSLVLELARWTGGQGELQQIAQSVQELRPLLDGPPELWWFLLALSLGAAWIPAAPAAVALGVRALRTPDGATTLFALWAAVMLLGAFWQQRMLVYAAPVVAVLAGAGSAWLVDRSRRLPGRLAAGALIACGLLAGAWIGHQGTTVNAGPDRDWLHTLNWLRQHTPDPFGGDGERLWSALNNAESPAGEADYGIAVWWDFGYWVQALGRRPPWTNGTQARVIEASRLYTETDPDKAVELLRASRLHYLIVDPAQAMPGGRPTIFRHMLRLAGRDARDFVRYLTEAGSGRPLTLYLPGYYRSLAVRLYLHGGGATRGSGPLWLVETDPEAENRIRDARRFATEAEARQFITDHPGGKYVYGCLDPRRSCLPLAGVPALRLVFDSSPGALSNRGQVTALKVFRLQDR